MTAGRLPASPRWQRTDLAKYCDDDHIDAPGLLALLRSWGMFCPDTGVNGLRPAVANPSTDGAYRFAWLRDNMHLAWVDVVAGRIEAAVCTVRAWQRVFSEDQAAHSHRGAPATGGGTGAASLDGPPVKVDADTGRRVSGTWPHAQHDALGLFVWVMARLLELGHLEADQATLSSVRDIHRHLLLVRYWSAQDSGHWEEEARVNASSIGSVVAGASAWVRAAAARGVDKVFDPSFIDRGGEALRRILPWETPSEELRARRCDAALVFLLEPYGLVTGASAMQIVDDVVGNLGRQHGIARYVGDSYWAADYRTLVVEQDRAADYSHRIDERNQLAKPELEAQWTLFDPVLSTWFGKQWAASGDPQLRQRQRMHLLRSLAAITPPTAAVPGRLPEAYFLEQGQWVPNDHVPLLWAEANLEVCLDRVGAQRSKRQHPALIRPKLGTLKAFSGGAPGGIKQWLRVGSAVA